MYTPRRKMILLFFAAAAAKLYEVIDKPSSRQSTDCLLLFAF